MGMSVALLELMGELEQFGEENDRSTDERAKRMLNITRDTGQLLSVLVRSTNARRVLEIGSSNGYSTLWLASAAQAIGGHVRTVEFSEYKAELARKNFQRSGLAPRITLLQDDARNVLAQAGEASFDLIFLDSARQQYAGWWADLRRVLRPGGLLVVDNAISHAGEIAALVALVEADPEFTTVLVPIGKGEYLATRAPRND